MSEHNTEATHYVADFFGIKEAHLLDNMDYCLATVKEAIEAAKCGILNIYQHKFTPQGISINATLSESHCAIHTWPEKGYCAIDLYGCGRAELHKGIEIFEARFRPEHTKIVKLSRGSL
jgi:S-adenosylmethionine decarboxylase